MKKLLLATVALFGAIGAAAAADMTVPYNKAPPPAAPTTSDWTGFYLGLDGGWGTSTSTLDTASLSVTPAVPGASVTQLFTNPKPSGALFGGHAGYNWQYGIAVAGVEVDYLSANMTESQSIVNPATLRVVPGVTDTFGLATKFDALASARARLGVSVIQNLLVYGTGGAAWGHQNETESLSITAPGASLNFSQQSAANLFGWVVGAGVEAKIWDHFLIRGQYLHYDFGDAAYSFPLAAAIPTTAGVVFTNMSSKTTVDAATGSIGYKF